MDATGIFPALVAFPTRRMALGCKQPISALRTKPLRGTFVLKERIAPLFTPPTAFALL